MLFQLSLPLRGFSAALIHWQRIALLHGAVPPDQLAGLGRSPLELGGFFCARAVLEPSAAHTMKGCLGVISHTDTYEHEGRSKLSRCHR